MKESGGGEEERKSLRKNPSILKKAKAAPDWLG